MNSRSTLYSLRTDGGQYRITKFVDGEPEGSYLTSNDSCECPVGHRHTCRHRQMLPQMLAHKLCNTHWFFSFDTGGQVVDFNGTSKHLLDQLVASRTQEETLEDTSSPAPNLTATEVDERIRATMMPGPDFTPELDAMFNELARIPGVQVMGLEDIGAVHNAIADAVGEPEAKPAVPFGQHSEPAPVAKPWRRI